MNLALQELDHYVRGLKTQIILKHLLSPQSYQEIFDLLELYPDSIIEFSSYSCSIGDLTGRNTVIWEVRNF